MLTNLADILPALALRKRPQVTLHVLVCERVHTNMFQKISDLARRPRLRLSLGHLLLKHRPYPHWMLV